MQGGDQQCNHTGIWVIPLQTQKGISAPCEHSGDLQKHTIAYGQKRRWGQLLMRIQQARLKVGLGMFPEALGYLGCVGEAHTNTVLGHNPKGLWNVVAITCKCNLYSAGGRFFGTYFKKLLDMMSISTLLEPLNMLSGKPASESLLLWRYTDLLEGSKRWSQQIERSGVFVYWEKA